MTDYCAFSKDHKCIKWTDYELLRHELEEADELCHNNWTEIQHLWEYIGQLSWPDTAFSGDCHRMEIPSWIW